MCARSPAATLGLLEGGRVGTGVTSRSVAHELRRRPVLVDGLVAVALLAVLAAATGPAAGPVSGPAWLRLLLLAGLTVPVAVRYRWPTPVLAVVLTVAVASLAVGMGRAPFLAAAYLAYHVATNRPAERISRGHLWLAGVAVPAALVGMQVLPSAVAPLDSALFGALAVGGGWTVGRAVRERRRLTEQAAHRLAERAVAAERLHIARELHDVVAHSISVIAVKAGVANHVLAARPEEAADALRVIEGASREALTELRHLLGALRGDGSDPAELGPAPGMAGLPALAAQAERAGVPVELVLPGGSADLPEGVELSTYRIVQEALTNVIRHAGPARCRVEVDVDRDAVRIEVTDTGCGPHGPASAGHGLIGMRERVAVYGGRFRAGPGPDGGFAVRAELPVRREHR
jgi:signal transduction histidine kinase